MKKVFAQSLHSSEKISSQKGMIKKKNLGNTNFCYFGLKF
jgi:hypothetical protein